MERFQAGVLITSEAGVTTYDYDGHLLNKYKPRTSHFIPWTSRISMVHVGSERIITNPNAIGTNSSVMLDTGYLAPQYNHSLMHWDQVDLLNVSMIKELQTIDGKIESTIDNVDLKYDSMASIVGQYSIMSYTGLICSVLLIVCVGIILFKMCKCCNGGQRTINDKYIC